MVSVLHSGECTNLLRQSVSYGTTDEHGSGRDETSRPAATESEHPQQRHP